MEKKINYLARTFNEIKSELINFSKKYYPEMSDNFNDASVGSWLIDMVSAVGDDLSYHTDRMYQENNPNSATLKSSVLNSARANGIKIPGPKPSMCEVELSCILPINRDENISQPRWDYAPIVKSGSIVGNSDYYFEITEDVNFKEQFNHDGVSNRRFVANKDSNGKIVSYTIYKSIIVYSGRSKVFKKIINQDELTPFMEVILPEKNIMGVESIIFKEGTSFEVEPKSFEYYIEKEEVEFSKEGNKTYRFFEVDSLSDQFRFGAKLKKEYDENMLTPLEVVDYKDIQEDNVYASRCFFGEWKAITQKFITEYTDNGYLKVIFGSGTTPFTPKYGNEKITQYGKHMLTKMVNNDLLGVLPNAGWVMYVLYRVGGGISTNLAPGAINSIIKANLYFSNSTMSAETKSMITNSLSVNNISASIGGKDMPSVDEIKNIVKYSIPSQKRCVTLKDYHSRIMSIPPKYGCPFRCNAIEENNKVIIPCLGIKLNGSLDARLPEPLRENLIEYLSHYKTLGDYIEIRGGKVYNLAFKVNVFISKNYVPSEVIKNVINTVKDYMDVSKHDMGEDIFLGDLEKKINMVDGVLSLIDMEVFSVYDGELSFPCHLPKETIYKPTECRYDVVPFVEESSNKKSFKIDLNKIDRVLLCDYDSMYQIENPKEDIIVQTKIR